MAAVTEDLPQPRLDHLSSLAALVLLSYGMVRIIDLPSLSAGFVILGLVVPVTIDTRLVMLTLAAALAVVGADWLVRSHPRAAFEGWPVRHWIVPGLAALGVGGLVTRLPEGAPLWAGLGLGAALLMAVFIAEYVVVEPADPRHGLAAFGLRNLAYGLMLASVFVLRATSLRVIFAFPLVFLAGLAVSWRLQSLDHPEVGPWPYPAVVGWVTAQVALGLHYWPISPIRDGLLLMLTLYLSNTLVGAMLSQEPLRRKIPELAAVAAVGLGAILILV